MFRRASAVQEREVNAAPTAHEALNVRRWSHLLLYAEYAETRTGGLQVIERCHQMGHMTVKQMMASG